MQRIFTWISGTHRILILVTVLGLAARPVSLSGSSVALAWNASPSAGVIGYQLLSSQDGINFNLTSDAGSNLSALATGLIAGSTNYFEVVAYDGSSNQSAPSVAVQYVAPMNPQTVTVSSSSTAAGSVSGGGDFENGSVITVTASANAGYTFSAWLENGVTVSSSATYTFTLSTNFNLTATFNQVTTSVPGASYTVLASPGADGSINPAGAQTISTTGSLVFNAVPDSGYQPGEWLINGVPVQTGGASFTLSGVNNNVTIGLTFTALPVVVSTNVPAIVQTNTSTNATLSVSGQGAVTPKLNGKFTLGKSYNLTAVPTSGSVFSAWILNGTVVSTTAKYTFLPEAGSILIAQFISNPFSPTTSRYHGLFYVTNQSTADSSGSISATVTGKGAYSGVIRLSGQTHPISGSFSAAGRATKSIFRNGLNPLTVQLQLNTTNGNITGAVSDGTWSADLVANAAAYNHKSPAPQAGKYTLIIPGSTDSSSQPGGNSFGSVAVDTEGNVSLSGILADGTPFSSTSVITSDGQWPFYVSLYNGKGSALGWMTFTNSGDIAGQVGWFKLPQASAKLYPQGFTISAEALGSPYQPRSGASVLKAGQVQLSLVNGNLTAAITNQVSVGSGVQPSTVAFKTLSGLFRGTVANPANGQPISVSGAVLQNQNLGAGFFLGQSESGSVLLSSAD